MPQFETYWTGLADGTLDDAGAVGITDAGGYFTATNVEGALQELGAAGGGGGGVTEVWVPATNFIAITGAPSIGASGFGSRVPTVLFDASATEVAGAVTWIPSDWSTLNAQLYWINNGSGSGDVRFQFLISFETTSSTGWPAISAASTDNYTAGAEDTVVVTTVGSGLSCSGGQIVSLQVLRSGSNVADTLGNDAGVIAVKLTKAS